MLKCNNPYHHATKNQQLCREHAVEAAARLCQKRQIRFTAQRKTVLELMLKADRAMSAYDLLDQLKQLEPQAKPPTIYRALDFLLEQGFIHKVESSNSYIVCPHFDDPSHISILFICDRCQMITEDYSPVIEQELQTLAQHNQLQIRHSVLEIHGLCHHCQA